MEPFLSQIMTVAFPFAPYGWALCGGQALPVSQNEALYALIGAQFGGGGTSFNLPNCAGRTTLGCGRDAWGVSHDIGVGGSASVAISFNNMPPHTHGAQFTPTRGTGPSSVTLSGSIDLPVSGPLSGGLGARNVGGGDATPGTNDALGVATIQIYAPSSAGAAVPLRQMSLQGSLTGTLDTELQVTAAPPPATVSLQQTGASAPAPLKLTPPYVVQTVIMATLGTYPMQP